jgi:DNA-binding NtrC family response regulator
MTATHLLIGSAERILIVDDEKSMRVTLAAILRDEGYDVTTAATGEEAVALCAKESFSVVLMDVRMPGINGVEAFRRIRRHQPGVRVILMSAYSVEALRDAALDEGAIAFLTKPLALETVVNLIREVTGTAILVVEKDEETALALQDNLRSRGYRVTVTASPHEALELVEQIRFDLIFLDVNLPAMNGLELYLAIKKITPSAVAVMITGMEEEFETLAREAVRRNAYTFVRKPLEIEPVLALLQRIVCRRASGDPRKPEADASRPSNRDPPLPLDGSGEGSEGR